MGNNGKNTQHIEYLTEARIRRNANTANNDKQTRTQKEMRIPSTQNTTTYNKTLNATPKTLKHI